MISRMRAPFSTALAIAIGLIVLLGTFFEAGILSSLRRIFLHWAVILASVALIIGVLNLVWVHWKKLINKQRGGFYSLILIASLLVTLCIAGFFGPTSVWSMWIFNYIQVPIESSLTAIIAVILIYALARLARRKINLFKLVFLATTLFLLIGSAPVFGIELPGLYGPTGLRDLIMRVPVTAGIRGILLGVSLGTVATGLRVLLGADRPYGR